MRRSLRESKIFAPFSTNPHFAREAKMTSNMNATALKANHYPSAVSLANPAADSQPLCVRCGYSGSDVRILGCGCTFHAVSHHVYFVQHGNNWLEDTLDKK